MPRKYRVFDLYEAYGTVADCDTMEEAENIVSQWTEETDGECDLVIMEWSEIYSCYVGIWVKEELHESN
jgi:hypothetical protein